ncbi:MAG TPA: hypothetical protein VFQ53_12255 [Kofleriaceae bacterium]|nr:hypothetical protein [Kofleriaceae bacterium]
MRYALLLVALAGCTVARADDDKVSAGKAAFVTVHQVLLHPRCMNCHPAGDAPLQHVTSVPHAQNISRRSEKNGLRCATCHRDRNGTRPGQPPGAPNWHLPPEDMPMIFEGRTPNQLCKQLKDPRQNGNRTLAQIVHHVEDDKLVGWGWEPGPGREPVPIPRDQVVAALKMWVAAGAPCPD